MSNFHHKTLDLLDFTGAMKPRRVSQLKAWAAANDIKLPKAYLEWAEIDDGSLLCKYSNGDPFFFRTPLEVITTTKGLRGVLFGQENQGCFEKMCLLDAGDDPPVMLSRREDHWITFADRFSECVYAQIFDWQYYFDCDPENQSSTAYSGSMRFNNDYCIKNLRRLFEEAPTTRLEIIEESFTEYRFLKSKHERLIATVQSNGETRMNVMGATSRLSAAFEAELLEIFSDELVIPSFNSLSWMLNDLDYHIDEGRFAKIRHQCVRKPTTQVMRRLAALHKNEPLQKRAENLQLDESAREISGPDWGVLFRLTPLNQSWWVIEEILAC